MILSVLVFTGCSSIKFSGKNVRVELGGELSQNALDYIEVSEKYEDQIEEFVLDLSNVDSMSVGEYEAVVIYRDEKIITSVTVEDTTAPIIIPKEVQFEVGDKVYASDLVEVSDYSDVTLKLLSYCGEDDTYGREYDAGMVMVGDVFVVKAIDAYGNETILEVMPEVIKNEDEAEEILRSEEFPNGDLNCVDEPTYEYIKGRYDEIEWYGEFEQGDMQQYDFYKGKFKALLDNDVPFRESEDESGEVKYTYLDKIIYIDEKLLPEKIFNGERDRYSLLFFDIDSDQAPELCITENIAQGGEGVRTYYIFKYDEKNDEIVLWDQVNGPYNYIMGSQKWGWDHYNQDGFYQCDENGKPEIRVSFREEENYESDSVNYLVTIPQYNGTETEIPDKIKEQGYYSQLDEQYFWVVTEEQFNELTTEYFDAYELAKEKRKEVTYTYNELF